MHSNFMNSFYAYCQYHDYCSTSGIRSSVFESNLDTFITKEYSITSKTAIVQTSVLIDLLEKKLKSIELYIVWLRAEKLSTSHISGYSSKALKNRVIIYRLKQVSDEFISINTFRCILTEKIVTEAPAAVGEKDRRTIINTNSEKGRDAEYYKALTSNRQKKHPSHPFRN
jgi:hypothetical protein